MASESIGFSIAVCIHFDQAGIESYGRVRLLSMWIQLAKGPKYDPIALMRHQQGNSCRVENFLCGATENEFL